MSLAYSLTKIPETLPSADLVENHLNSSPNGKNSSNLPLVFSLLLRKFVRISFILYHKPLKPIFSTTENEPFYFSKRQEPIKHNLVSFQVRDPRRLSLVFYLQEGTLET